MPSLPARPQARRVNALVPEDDYTIVAAFGMRYRGIVQYYLLARNVYILNRLQWVMQTSMLRTLATKHRSTVTKMKTKHRVVILTNTANAPPTRPAWNAGTGSRWSPPSVAYP